MVDRIGAKALYLWCFLAFTFSSALWQNGISFAGKMPEQVPIFRNSRNPRECLATTNVARPFRIEDVL
jgi:hypothetical protein